MTDFIGARISLLSKSDIRYVGTLHEINGESSTVALEQVVSYGTEGRRNNPEDEIAPADSVYEYIVFKGSDVKDLRIEEAPKENVPPQVPDDPAILGSGSRPPQSGAQSQALAQGQQQRPPQPPQFQQNQQPPYPYFYPPPPGQRFGPHGPPPPGPGFPNAPFGAPPGGWYPPPGQGFPHHPGQFPNQQMPFGPPGHGQQPGAPKPSQVGPSELAAKQSKKGASEGQDGSKGSSKAGTPAPPGLGPKGPTPPLESKPDVATAIAPPAPQNYSAAAKAAPPGVKGGRIVPAVPLPSPGVKGPGATDGQTGKAQPSQAAANAALQNATQAATAAVAAAMAKLPPAPGQKGAPAHDGVDDLTKKVNEMRTNEHARTSRGDRGHGAGHRGGRGRGASAQQTTRKMDVPKTDYDFQSANAKFNKQDLVKEVIATGSPATTPVEAQGSNGVPEAAVDGHSKSSDDVVIPPAPYNKSTSFFDNISSETKDRNDANGQRPGGREWRGEEQKKNLETFGQGSVDNGYRGGFRGRGRGRGFGNRGRGGGGNRGGRGGHRGRGDVQPGQQNGVSAGT